MDEIESAVARGVDAVCHIAGQVSIIRSFNDPTLDLRTNVEGTINVLRQCVKHRVPRLLYASSMTIYGNGGAVPTPETERCWPDSYYGITKLAGERYVHATAERPDLDFEFKVTSLRMYSVYGPGQALDNPYQGVLGIFLGNRMRGEPITIFGDGQQTRDFVFIDDIVNGWVMALNTPATAGHSINLGSGRSTSINQLAEHAIAAVDGAPDSSKIVRRPPRPGEQRSVQADVRKAKALMGWEPKVPFEKGLAETLRWARADFAAKPAAKGSAPQ
jgi:UDP-glucose 4-epimerase